MATLLLAVIYTAFISLGLPDSLFGTAWPAIYPEFGLPFSIGGLIAMFNSFCTMLSSMFSPRVINRFGTGRVTAVSTVLTAAALIGFSFSGHIIFLILFSIPLGFGGGAIDTALNNYVALHYKATHMSFLHCFYGVGVSVSPYVMSLALSALGDWHMGYRVVAFIQMGISVMLFFALPLWKKVRHTDENGEEEEPQTPRSLTYREMMRDPAVVLTWGIFGLACAIECTTGAWASTFLVEAKGFTVDAAAVAVAAFYGGMAIGRFLSGVLSIKLTPWKIVFLGMGTLAAAFVVLLLPLPEFATVIGLLLIGTGVGPIFPNFMYLSPRMFGRDVSQSVIGSQMASAYVGIMLTPPLFGALAQMIGIGSFPLVMAVIFVLMLVCLIVLIRLLKKQNKYEG